MLNQTWNRYIETSANPQGRRHASSAYLRAAAFDDLNDETKDYSRFTAIESTKLVGGRLIQFRSMCEDRATEYKYIRDNDEGMPLRINGELQYYTTEEMIDLLGAERHHHWFAAFDLRTGKVVGRTQDEWGCLLVLVPEEYANMGIGTELVKLQLEKHPDMDSGGFTPQGYSNRHRVYSNSVRRAFAASYYRDQYKTGTLTMDNIRTIREDLRDAKPRFKHTGKLSLNPLDPLRLGVHSSMGAVYMYHNALYTDEDINPNVAWGEMQTTELCLGYAYVLEGIDTRRLLNSYGQDLRTERNAILLAIASMQGDTVYIERETTQRLDLDHCAGLARTGEALDSMRRIPFRATVALDEFLALHNRKHNALQQRFDPYMERTYNILEQLVSLSEV